MAPIPTICPQYQAGIPCSCPLCTAFYTKHSGAGFYSHQQQLDSSQAPKDQHQQGGTFTGQTYTGPPYAQNISLPSTPHESPVSSPTQRHAALRQNEQPSQDQVLEHHASDTTPFMPKKSEPGAYHTRDEERTSTPRQRNSRTLNASIHPRDGNLNPHLAAGSQSPQSADYLANHLTNYAHPSGGPVRQAQGGNEHSNTMNMPRSHGYQVGQVPGRHRNTLTHPVPEPSVGDSMLSDEEKASYTTRQQKE